MIPTHIEPPLWARIVSAREKAADIRQAVHDLDLQEKERRLALTGTLYADGRISATNQAHRDVQIHTALANDPEWAEIKDQIEAGAARLAQIETALENLVEERRASEWRIREKLADAMLAQAGIAPLKIDSHGGIRVPADPGSLSLGEQP